MGYPDCLIDEFGERRGFLVTLMAAAWHHGPVGKVTRALRLVHRLFGTPIETYETPVRLRFGWNAMDPLYRRRLLARDGWGRPTRRLTRFAFYVRSHWLRMPPAMLARHLWIKWRRVGGPGGR